MASAPSIFQTVMDQILQGLDHVTCFLDDILVTASSKEEHIRRLDEVLTKLERYSLRVKLSKCQFMQTSIEYLVEIDRYISLPIFFPIFKHFTIIGYRFGKKKIYFL